MDTLLAQLLHCIRSKMLKFYSFKLLTGFQCSRCLDGDSAGNTAEENSSVFSLIRMH